MAYDFLVLGADGQIGVLCSRYLLAHGYTVMTADVYRDTITRETREFGDRTIFRYCDHRYTTDIADTIRSANGAVVLDCADDYYADNVFDACLLTSAHHIDFGGDLSGTRRRVARGAQFRAAGLTAVMGCGSVPGIGGAMLGFLSRRCAKITRAESGFAWNSNQHDFVPPFFLFVVMYELSEPAQVLRHGQLRSLPSMSLSRTRKFEGVGRQTVYAVPHPEVWTYKHYYPTIREATFWAGFPKHSLEVIKALIAVGLHRNKPIATVIDTGDVLIHPCDFITAICKEIKFPDSYEESENLWTEVWGRNDGKALHHKMECLVPPIKGYKRYGCNVDTAFPGCVIAEMVRDGEIQTRGVFCTESDALPVDRFLQRMVELGFRFQLDGFPISIDSAGQERHIVE
jgi:saccharopine dehydrogenase-like NADP-dependent oxidoreductase